MNTPAHLIVAAAAFARAEKTPGDGARAVTTGALLGGFIPDFSLYFAFLWSTLVLGRSPGQFFGEDYFSAPLQAVFAVDNSVFVWGALLAVALWAKRPVLVAFAGAALLHIALDFPLHHDDGRPHFWPLTDWVYASPVSYWDTNHHAGVFAPLEAALCGILLVILWRRFAEWPARGAILLAGAAQAYTFVMWNQLAAGG